ncbi:MAG: hypothetical protein WBP84_10195 [Nitrososphaeraceae archaeon]
MARILLVDDDKEHLKLFTIVLEEQGHSVEVYADPITALLRFSGTRLPYASSKWPRLVRENQGD